MWIIVASLVISLAVAGAAIAQTTGPDRATYPNLLDSTLSAGGDLEEDETPHTSFFRRPTLLDPYFAWKRSVRERYGLGFSGSWGVLWQNYSDSLIGESNAVGSKFAFNLHYDLWNRNRPDALSIDMAIEDRRALGTELPPQLAGLGAGSGLLTATTWGQFDMGITQLYLRQNLFENRFQYAIGKLFAPSYIDPYPFFDGNRQFLNQQFSQNPTIASPLWGFGMVGAWYPAESGLYIKPGIFTPYSSDTGSTISDFFNENQYFYLLEVGLSALARSGVPIQARGAMDTDNIHLTSWYRDSLPNSAPRAYGFAFNANYMYGENMMWFVRAGWSEGWLIDRSVSAGVGWRPPNAASDLLGAGVGWSRPASPSLDGQTTGEIFYRFHVTPNFAVTSDLQVIVKPSLNPNVNTLWVFGVRARISF